MGIVDKKLFRFLLLCVVLNGCVTKPPPRAAETEPPPYIATGGSTPVQQAPVPGQSAGDVSATPLPAGRELRGPITLVLGGAGVASFATVGILKKMQEDGVKIESIIVTGWPAIFSVGYGMMKTVHDLEWFAMRLEQSDFSSGGLFGSDKGFSDHDRIRATVTRAFTGTSLNQTRVPIVLSASNSTSGQPEVYSSGNWIDPLLKAISVPGTFRPYGEGPGLGWVSTLGGLDVEEAQRRGAKSILAFSMYDDFLISLQDARSADAETLFRNLYGAQLGKGIRAALKKSQGASQIRLSRPPNDFSAKRLAIQLGYQEATKLLKAAAGKN